MGKDFGHQSHFIFLFCGFHWSLILLEFELLQTASLNSEAIWPEVWCSVFVVMLRVFETVDGHAARFWPEFGTTWPPDTKTERNVSSLVVCFTSHELSSGTFSLRNVVMKATLVPNNFKNYCDATLVCVKMWTVIWLVCLMSVIRNEGIKQLCIK